MLDQKKSIAFENAKNKIIGVDRERIGIGTLSEKTVHAVLKNYLEPDEDKQEIPIGTHVADIYSDGKIIEIQTRSLSRLKAKLDEFLPDYEVTIVHPIPHIKWLIWVNEETGELSNKRKSPKKGTVYTAMRELYTLRDYLSHPNVRVKLILMDVEEYKLLNGWSKDKKHGATRYDGIPVDIVEEIDLNCPKDYMQLIPADLPERFTAKDFAKAAKVNGQTAALVVSLCRKLEIIDKVGKVGNAFLYECRY